MATIAIQPVEHAHQISGGLPYRQEFPEKAGQTFKVGAFVTFDVNGYITECAANDARIVGIANSKGKNGATDGVEKTTVIVATADTVFYGNMNSTTSLNDRGRGFRIAKDGTTGNWVVDKASDAAGASVANARVIVMQIDSRDALGDTNGRVLFTIRGANRALTYTSEA